MLSMPLKKCPLSLPLGARDERDVERRLCAVSTIRPTSPFVNTYSPPGSGSGRRGRFGAEDANLVRLRELPGRVQTLSPSW